MEFATGKRSPKSNNIRTLFFFSYRLGTLPPQQFVLRMNPVRKIYDPSSLKTSFDSRIAFQEYGIAGIQDQGWCGSSWAISTAAVASDR